MSTKQFFIQILCATCLCLLFSCSDKQALEDYGRIKKIGDEDPSHALAMLDSLEIEIREQNDYVRKKYDLLRIRLNDKAFNTANSDLMIKKLLEYFEEKGSLPEKQEVTYYAGSVYRDLQDAPRSMEYFLKSLEYAQNDGSDCDSLMMRNAYSNLNDLYYKVNNYDAAVKMAQAELEISKQMHKDVILPYLHLGTAYLAQEKQQEAEKAFDAVLDEIIRSKDVSSHQSNLLYLLNDYSCMELLPKARKCFSMIETDPLEEFSDFPCMAFAQYYNLCGKTDSAIVYCNLVLDKGTDIYNQYDASRLLHRIYNRRGDVQNANQYAAVYMALSDSLDFGKRQELAATVNNQFQYHLDQQKEQSLKDEKERYKNTLIIVALAAILLASIGYMLYVRRRSKHLKEVLNLSTELQQVSSDEKQLRRDVEQKEKNLEELRASLEKTTDELSDVKNELERVNAELSEYEEALKEREQQLSEKMDQNKTVIQMLHQSELEGKAEDVIYAIRQSSAGKKNMTSTDWKQLYHAVDELYPSFKERLLAKLGNFTEQQMQVCYLMRIGLSKPQIQNMTNLSRVTVWRWVKKYDWVLTSVNENGVAEQNDQNDAT